MKINFTKSALALATVLSLGVSSVAAQAQTPGSSASHEKAASAGREGGSSARQAAPETKYCFMSEVTGSRITRKECRTKKEWQSIGVEIPSQIHR
jgi:hypothetical protein